MRHECHAAVKQIHQYLRIVMSGPPPRAGSSRAVTSAPAAEMRIGHLVSSHCINRMRSACQLPRARCWQALRGALRPTQIHEVQPDVANLDEGHDQQPDIARRGRLDAVIGAEPDRYQARPWRSSKQRIVLAPTR